MVEDVDAELGEDEDENVALSIPYESGLIGFFDASMFVLEALVLENFSHGPSIMVGRCGCLP